MSSEDDELLCEGFEKMAAELKQIDEKIEEDPEVDLEDLDKAAFALPSDDQGYLKILKSRFGHTEFKEG